MEITSSIFVQNIIISYKAYHKGSSREKNYRKLGVESLKWRRWYRRLICMFKIMKEKAPNYLKNLIPISQSFRTRTNRVPTFHCRTDCIKNYFLLSTLSDWFKLDVTIKNTQPLSIFKNRPTIIHPSSAK